MSYCSKAQFISLYRVLVFNFTPILRHIEWELWNSTRASSKLGKHLNICFSKHRPSGPMLSISRNVRLCVCPSVCVFTFEVPFKHLFAPTSFGCPIFFRASESLGKSNGKKWSKIAKQKNSFFLADFAFQNMVETTPPDGLETSGRRAYRLFWHISRCFWVSAFAMIFSVFQTIWVFGYFLSTWKPCFPTD